MCLQRNIKLTLMSHLTLLLFVESFSKLQTPDIYDLGEVQVASLPITSDNAATPHVIIDDKSIIDLSSTISDVENRLNLMIHTLTLKLQLQILNMPAVVRNKLLLKVQPMIIIKQPL